LYRQEDKLNAAEFLIFTPHAGVTADQMSIMAFHSNLLSSPKVVIPFTGEICLKPHFPSGVENASDKGLCPEISI
jgi:hypothetical protein